MRLTTVFRRLLGVIKLFVTSVEFEVSGLVLGVRPSWRRPRCGHCGQGAPGYDRLSPRRWRHLGIGSTRIWLQYAPRRVQCRHCGIRTEQVPWAAHKSRFTWDFEELTAYLVQATDKTKVTKLMGISWLTVGAIVERIVAKRLDAGRFDDLERIGVDEFSYRRLHRFLTVVVDHDRRRVIWAAKGRSTEVLKRFFAELGEERSAKIKCATIDMAIPYITALQEMVPHAKIIFDRFHVQRLATDAVDEVRRFLLRKLRGTDEGRTIFKSRFALFKNPWNLDRTEKEKLNELQQTNAPLYRAYLLKETLAQALDYRQPWRAKRALKEWLAWASRSRLPAFVRMAKTIRKRFDGVLGYVEERLTNGIVEGFNSRFRMIARRAFGFHGPEPLIAMMFLCCGGIQLDPPLPLPT